MLDMAEAVLFSHVTVISLLACAAQFVLSFALAQLFSKKRSGTDRWILVWLFYDAIVHITLVSTGAFFIVFIYTGSDRLLWSVFSTGRSLRVHVTVWNCGNIR